MPRRIDIELTSSRPDGSWTWRAAGAREPKGVLDGSILPGGANVGDELKVEVEQELDGLTVLGVVHSRAKVDRPDVLELLPNEQPFEPVTQQRARRERDDRRPGRPRRERGEGGGERRDRDRVDRHDRGERPRREGEGKGGGDRRDRGERPARGPRPERRERPSFTPPPELPQRPKPKRLRPGKTHRTEVLAALPDEQRPIAELALQGMAAVRQRLKDDNRKLAAEGKATMPEASVLKLAEELLPRLRAAEWLDRAEAAKRQLEHLDLRDLRSVVAAADDPMVARDESTRELAADLKAALVTKQERELQLWLGDIEAALDVGRVIRALRLSSQPPKAGVPFPHDLAVRLVEGAQASLTPADGPDRWSAVLEAAAFSPVRSLIAPAAAPEHVNDELRATMTRLAPALPKIAALFAIEVRADAPMPKPLRPAPRQRTPRPPERKRSEPSTATAAAPQQPAPEQPPPPDEDRPAAPDAEPDTGTPPPPDEDRPASPDEPPDDTPPPPDPERPVPLDDEPGEGES